MSWNIATRLNNLQYQINGKVSNPLTVNLDCDNNSIIDCSTLHYQHLDPPVSVATETIEQILQTGDDANGENIQNVGTLSLAQQNFQDTDLVNQDVIISQLSGLGNRLNVYMASDVTSPFSSSALLATGQLLTTSGITCGGGLNVGSTVTPSNITLDGNLVINQDGAPTGSTTLSATAGNLLSVSGGLTTTGNITCSQLNYTTLNPPVSSGSQNLQQVLTVGNDAGGLNISNVGNTFTSSIQGTGVNGTLQIGNSASNFYANNDGSGNRTLVLGDCITNFNNSGLVLGLNDPTFSTSPATKNYVDNTVSNLPTSGCTYIEGTPDEINVAIPNSGAITTIWVSGSFSKPAGKTQQIMITFNNKNILSGPNNTNLITGLVDISNNGLFWTPSSIDPYGNGFLFSPAFLAWVNIPSAYTTYYIRIRGLQTNVSVPSYQINANLMITTFQS